MTEHNKHIDESQLLQFLLGELSEQETQQISEWLLSSAENQKTLDQMEAVWAETGKLTPNPVAVDIPFAWEKMSEKIDLFESGNQKDNVIPLGRKRMYRFVSGIAAALFIGFGIFQLINMDRSYPEVALASTKNVVYSSLPDGSEIALNLNSKITYPKKFNKNVREVNLDGEAYFSVQHNSKQPFIVNAGNAKIKVLGTKFRINHNSDNEVNVAVTSGKVQLFTIDSISGDTASVILRGGQQGALNAKHTEPVIINALLIPDDLFWVKRTLEFRQTKLSEVFMILEKNYQVEIRVENYEVNNCIYTASFTDSNIKDILDMLVASFDFELIEQNNIFVLRGDACLND